MNLPPPFLATAVLSENQYFLDLIVLILRIVAVPRALRPTQEERVGGRAFYTALGHTSESYTDSLFMTHLVRAIDWAAGR